MQTHCLSHSYQRKTPTNPRVFSISVHQLRLSNNGNCNVMHIQTQEDTHSNPQYYSYNASALGILTQCGPEWLAHQHRPSSSSNISKHQHHPPTRKVRVSVTFYIAEFRVEFVFEPNPTSTSSSSSQTMAVPNIPYITIAQHCREHRIEEKKTVVHYLE